MYRQNELWYEPLEKIYKKQKFISEMNRHDHGFLCGMIKKMRPKKILEIGVAEGGTTAVIMETLAILGLESEVWSVDLVEDLYCDSAKKTGYEYFRLEKELGQEWGKHHFLFGRTIAHQIGSIGDNIDMVILDTTHKMPGEVLDFLCVFPYLAANATIVLHDINLNYSRAVLGDNAQIIGSKDSIATKLLLLTVAAEKYMVLKQGEFPNIAAFCINENTGKYMEDIFYLLTLTWSYIPRNEMLQEYRILFEKYYSKSCLTCFDMAWINNTRILERHALREIFGGDEVPKITYMFPYNQISEGSKIVIYGAGRVGKEVYMVQSKRSIYHIAAWVDSNSEEYRKKGMDVISPEELAEREFDYIVVAVESDSVFTEIHDEILRNKWDNKKIIVGPIKKYSDVLTIK